MRRSAVLAIAGSLALVALTMVIGAGSAGAKPKKPKKPDLQVEALDGNPGTTKLGSGFELSDVVVNAGKKKAKRSVVAYSLSDNRKADAADIELGGSRRVPKLKPKQTSAGTTKVRIPATATPGRYFVIACADAGEKVKEKKESNNCRTSENRSDVAGPATYAFTPASVTFAERTPDPGTGGSFPVTFTLHNTSAFRGATLDPAAIAGDTTSFNAVIDNCGGLSLGAGQTCSILVQFTPKSAGLKSATLTIADRGGSAAQASLKGTAVEPAELTMTPASHDFGSHTINSFGGEQTFTVTNTGGRPSGLINPEIGGTDADQFSLTGGGDCGVQTLDPGESCTVTAGYFPTSTGAKSGTLTVTSNLATDTSTLTGTGT